MIEVKNLTKKYGANTVVNKLTFTIEKGKIYGLLGPNGAGKSTTMNMITGFLAPTDGQILINGLDIYDNAREAKKSIGYLPENPPVYPDMTPEEYLCFVAGAKGLKYPALLEEVYRVMEKTDILDRKDRLIKNLSKGYRQRVGIAQAILGDPELIILDEPTVGLDPRQISEIRELISKLGKDRTVILSSHILAEISAVCEHVMIINQGNLVASDTLENIKKHNMPENIIDLTVKASEKQIKDIMGQLKNIVSFDVSESNDPEYKNVTVEGKPDCEIRELLYFAFAEKKIPIIKLAKSELSLEEIFFKLTDPEYLYNEEEYDEDTSKSDANDEPDSEQSEVPAECSNTYVPLFKNNTEEKEEE